MHTVRTIELTRTDLAVAAGLSLVLLWAGWMVMVPGVTGVFHDDAVYVSTAKALATGEGYRLIDLPGEPRQTKYPILYPAVLAVVWLVWPTFPDNVAAMQWLTLGCAAMAAAIAYLYLVRFGYATRPVAAGACAVCATAPLVLYLSSLTLSEAPFALLTLAALWRAESELRRAPVGGWARDVVTGMILALPYLCRSIGVVLILSGLAVWVAHRRRVRWVLVGVVAATAPWLGWAASGAGEWQADQVTGYYVDYVGAWSSLALSDLFSIVQLNVLLVASWSVSIPAAGLLDLLPRVPIALRLLLAATGLAGWGWIAWTARRPTPLKWFLLLYVTMVIVWPWPPARFLVPVLPAYLSLAGEGIWKVTVRLRWTSSILGLSLLAMLMGNLWYGALTADRNSRYGYPLLAPVEQPAEWAAFVDLFEWLKRNTGPGDVVAAPLDGMIGLYVGRSAFRPFVHRPDRLFYGAPGSAVGEPEELLKLLGYSGARYLVVTPLFQFSEWSAFDHVVRGLRTDWPSVLNPVFIGVDSRFVVYEIRIH